MYAILWVHFKKQAICFLSYVGECSPDRLCVILLCFLAFTIVFCCVVFEYEFLLCPLFAAIFIIVLFSLFVVYF